LYKSVSRRREKKKSLSRDANKDHRGVTEGTPRSLQATQYPSFVFLRIVSRRRKKKKRLRRDAALESGPKKTKE
jgi:hypothetical protein